MALAPQFLDDLRSRISLAGVVQRHVKLTKRGREFIGLCPFHNEKTPSFNVVEDKHFYHCFGCGAHGDVIGFTMRFSNLSFRDAIEQLAREAGVQVPVESPQERDRQVKAASLHDVCEAACSFFQAQLKDRGGKQAVDYLARRGIDAEAIERFRLGWAPDARDALKRTLMPQISEELLVTAGLLKKSERGDSYDFFRGRVIFPISDRSGKIIAFGGRTLGDGQPKYLNSPDTPIFDKGRTLYGLHTARANNKSEWPPIVVEGYTDVIGLHLAGFTRAVAPLGTALSEVHLLELWQMDPEPVICFDGDAAGQRATNRCVEIALPNLRPEWSLRFVQLPEKDDPDSFIRANGSQAFAQFLKTAPVLSEFLWTAITGGKKPSEFNTGEKLSRLEKRITERTDKIANSIVQRNFQHYLMGRYWDIRRQNRRARVLEKDQISAKLLALAKGVTGVDSRQHDIEIIIISMALNHPDIALKDIDSYASLEVKNREMRDIWQIILEEFDGKNQPDSVRLRLALEEHGYSEVVDRVFRSQVFKNTSFAQVGAEPEWAARGWKQTAAKSRLPTLKQELDEVKQRWTRDPSNENFTTLSMYRQLAADLETEEEYVKEYWESAEFAKGVPPTLH